MKHTYETGLAGEDEALEYLRCEKGMIPLEHRYRSKQGEIDLIMKDRNTFVFVEVKTRLTGEAGWGLSAVNAKKQRRITRAATVWMMEHRCMNAFVRFDLVEVNGSRILHVPNAFQPYGNFQH